MTNIIPINGAVATNIQADRAIDELDALKDMLNNSASLGTPEDAMIFCEMADELDRMIQTVSKMQVDVIGANAICH